MGTVANDRICQELRLTKGEVEHTKRLNNSNKYGKNVWHIYVLKELLHRNLIIWEMLKETKW